MSIESIATAALALIAYALGYWAGYARAGKRS
jgi:hypothetical protein